MIRASIIVIILALICVVVCVFHQFQPKNVNEVKPYIYEGTLISKVRDARKPGGFMSAGTSEKIIISLDVPGGPMLFEARERSYPRKNFKELKRIFFGHKEGDKIKLRWYKR